MKMKLLASLLAAFIATAVFAGSAKAENCRDYGTCSVKHKMKKKTYKKVSTYKMKKHKHKHVRVAHARKYTGKRSKVRMASSRVPRNRAPVVAMITSMAPQYGVPTWFALRIAKIESGYNPRARGAAGEYGVYQLKCATARGIGFRGNCGTLLNASTNVRYGLKHLALAMRSSRGNLRLAASKHNGGLGRKTMVAGYVRRVF